MHTAKREFEKDIENTKSLTFFESLLADINLVGL